MTFNYRIAEATLDAWCLSKDRPVGFRRVYLKLKVVTLAVAGIDYGDGTTVTEEDCAAAWEELQFACTGQGEIGLQGFLQQVWGYCREEEKPIFRKVCETAFELAERATDRSAPRLYPAKYRLLPFDWLADEPCNRPRRAPYRGPRLRDLLEEDARISDRIDLVLAHFEACEARDREPEERVAPTLRLVLDDSDH